MQITMCEQARGPSANSIRATSLCDMSATCVCKRGEKRGLDIRLLQIASDGVCIEKDKQRLGFPAGIFRHEGAEAGATCVVPDFQPAEDAVTATDTKTPTTHSGFIRDR